MIVGHDENQMVHHFCCHTASQCYTKISSSWRGVQGSGQWWQGWIVSPAYLPSTVQSLASRLFTWHAHCCPTVAQLENSAIYTKTHTPTRLITH